MDLFYPVQKLTDWFVFGLLSLEKNSALAGGISFFIYDSIKILILLFVIILAVSFIRSYLAPEKTKKFLKKRFKIVGNILAALIGVITPFCSCSAVPMFIGLVESGVPLGVTFSYLISAPMVNEVAAIMLLGLFGPVIAGIYIVSGVSIAVVVGYILGRMRLEKLVEDYVWKIKVGGGEVASNQSFKDRLHESYLYTRDLIGRVYPFVLLGVGVGALIHGYAPANWLAKAAGKDNLLAVPLATIVGVPLYSNAAGTIPIVKSLIEKGLPIGTALAFMMSVTALSLPEMIILRKVLKMKLLALYIVILSLGIMFTGYLFNIFL